MGSELEILHFNNTARCGVFINFNKKELLIQIYNEYNIPTEVSIPDIGFLFFRDVLYCDSANNTNRDIYKIFFNWRIHILILMN